MPLGTGIDFHFLANGEDRLVIDQVDVPDSTGSRIEITLLSDGKGEIELLDLNSSQKNLSIDLPTGGQMAVRLSLRAASHAVSPYPILLRGPRIETALSGTEIPAEASDSEARQLGSVRPNVLVYVVDTMRADHLGLYGYSRNVSPEIDEFGSQAYVFDQAMAQTSWTKPAVASIFTGLGTTAHGVNHREHRLPSRLHTMAELFSDASYRTAAFTTNAYFSTDSGLRQGFDEFKLQPARASRVHQQIFEWLDMKEGEDPFLLYVHTIDPHAPYDPPESFRREFAAEVEDPAAGSFEHIRGLAFGEIPRTPQTDQSLIRLYDAEIAYADRQFGLLLDDLRRRGLYDEMLILFVSDHGEGFYEHGVQGHGWDLYRESTQVPMILKLPGKSSGHRVKALAQQIDLLPTLLDLAGIEIPEVIQGRSLVPLLAREPTPEAEPVPVFSYLDYEGRRGMSVIYGQWKLIEPLSGSFAPSRELYDRLADPEEKIDLAAKRPILAGYLATLVRQRLLEPERLPEVESIEFDDQTRQQLRALGYLE
jgi:arylsulfatase A-like enzyme